VTVTAFVITMYAVGCDVKPNSPTRSGVMPAIEFTVAADPSVLPIGSIIEIEGFSGPRMVQDIGGLVKGNHVDVFVHSCKVARDWGKRKRAVRVIHVPKKEKR
jgi:3D (Asp-Asp-Asp) domain-containing protein